MLVVPLQVHNATVQVPDTDVQAAIGIETVEVEAVTVKYVPMS